MELVIKDEEVSKEFTWGEKGNPSTLEEVSVCGQTILIKGSETNKLK